jgi:hypothetical protein
LTVLPHDKNSELVVVTEMSDQTGAVRAHYFYVPLGRGESLCQV